MEYGWTLSSYRNKIITRIYQRIFNLYFINIEKKKKRKENAKDCIIFFSNKRDTEYFTISPFILYGAKYETEKLILEKEV